MSADPIDVTGQVFAFRCPTHNRALLPITSLRPGPDAWRDADYFTFKAAGLIRLDLAEGFYCPAEQGIEPQSCAGQWYATVAPLDDTTRCPRCLSNSIGSIGDDEHAELECNACGAAWSADEGSYIDQTAWTPLGGYPTTEAYR